MNISPLNLISTPLPMLNNLGLRLRVGLSSEDPMVGRHPTERSNVVIAGLEGSTLFTEITEKYRDFWLTGKQS